MRKSGRKSIHSQTRPPVLAILLLTLLAGIDPSPGQSRLRDLTELSIEELMSVEVSLAGRKPVRLSEISAAIDVVTGDEIRRTGAMNAPDALRFVPGMEIARMDANKWAVTARGFNSIYANKLLVLLDGRSLYSPIFSGVFWESQDILMEDVDRIEVIRGPGATLWGAGAMNGIVNIATRDARDTQGLFLSAGSGTEDKWYAAGRYGGTLGRNAHYRIDVKHALHDGFETGGGKPASDDWTLTSGGFRADWSPSRADRFTLQGRVVAGDIGQEGSPTLLPGVAMSFADYRTRTRSGYMLGRWHRVLSPRSDLTLRVSVDRTQRRDALVIGGRYTTIDVDAQHHIRAGERHDMVWGLGFRMTRNRMDEDRMASMNPSERLFRTSGAFVQDDIDLVLRRLRLTLGSKFETNDFTGLEVQPNVRLLWMPSGRHSVWASAARAVRIPDPGDLDLLIHYDLPPLRLSLSGNHGLEPEEMTAFECGWQARWSGAWRTGLNGYVNRYRGLHNYNIGDIRAITDPPAIEIPFYLDNAMTGIVSGVEVSIDVRPSERLRFLAALSALHVRLEPSAELTARYEALAAGLGWDRAGIDSWLMSQAGKSPERLGSFHFSWNPADRVDADVMVRFVDELRSLAVPAYTGVDARLGFRPGGDWELFVVGQNLAGRTHREFDEAPSPFGSTRMQRGVLCGANFRFSPR
jgi:iron complex outermembrane recepter protein